MSASKTPIPNMRWTFLAMSQEQELVVASL
jgi:hypothetical protein